MLIRPKFRMAINQFRWNKSNQPIIVDAPAVAVDPSGKAVRKISVTITITAKKIHAAPTR
jgi:hypothetical protein